MLLTDGPLTFREFVMHEEIPLATIFRAALELLAGRADAALFGAQAVNAYCEPERMTADVDVLSTRAAEVAEEIRARLGDRFHIATRVREIGDEGFRVFQLRKPSNRHLVDVRQIDALPVCRSFEGVQVVDPAELLAMKVLSMVRRAGRPKATTDLVDAQRLLLVFPELKKEGGVIEECLRRARAPHAAFARWRELVATPIEPDRDD